MTGAAASTNEAITASSKVISVFDLKARLSDGASTTDDFLLDIRRKEDFDASHIEGAVNVELDSWNAYEALSMYPEYRQIVVICYTGATARQVAIELDGLGYDAAVLEEGMYGFDPGLAEPEALMVDVEGEIEVAIGEFEKTTAATASASFT